MKNKDIKKLIIISNRLPFVLEKVEDKWQITPGSGGLVTALAPVLRDRGGLWIGWVGAPVIEHTSHPWKIASRNAGFSMLPVILSEKEIMEYYVGLSNEVIWPLFHDLQSYCNFDPAYWTTYKKINARFASVIADNANSDDFIWVHDYHLILVAKELRKLDIKTKIGYFLHIPFPPLDIFVKLPWQNELLRSLLDYDLIGFQTIRDRHNFVQCLRSILKDITIKGKGQVITVQYEGREIRVGNFPISIDYNEFSQLAKTQNVADRAWYIHEDIPDRKMVLGIDRLDYTKGIPYRLKAFRVLLQKHPELHRKITLIQIVVPSRRNIPVYIELKEEIERLVSEINGEYTQSGWVPIHYSFRSLPRIELLAHYRTSEIALITPLKDGMNLIAKEYCASNIEQTGVVILSKFAGAAAQLQRGAILVNPYDIEEVAGAIYTAFTMNRNERRSRMKKMQQAISKFDIYWWVNTYLNTGISSDLDTFPQQDNHKQFIKSLPK